MKLKVLLLTSLLAASSVCWSAPTKKPSGSYANSPFPVSASKLPVNYKGHDVEPLYRAVVQKTPEQGRYESESQYEDRLNNLQKKPLLGTVFLSSPIAIVVKPSWRKYDPDNESSISYFGMTGHPNEQGDTYATFFITKNEGRYISGVELVNARQLPLTTLGNNKYSLSFSKSVTRSKAQEYEDNIRAAYVGYFDQTPYSYGTDYGDMSLGKVDIHYIQVINLRVKKVVFFDQKTGTIYASYNAKG